MNLEKKFSEVGIPLGKKADEDKLPYVHSVEGQIPYKFKHRIPSGETANPKEGLHSDIYKISEIQQHYKERPYAVSYTHLTLPTNREV